jgi:elongator complex protein 1
LTTSRASLSPPHDHGAIAVIDGQSIKVTPYRTANIPPPMSLHDLEIPSNVIDVAFNSDASLLAVLHQHGISIYEWKNVAASGPAPNLTGRVTFGKGQISSLEPPCAPVYLQLSFTDKDEILVLQKIGSESFIKRYGFDDDTGRMEEISSNKSPSTNVSSLSSFCQDGVTHAFIQDKSGSLHSTMLGDHGLSSCNFPTFLPWVEIIPNGEDYIAFGMSPNGHLYANSRLLVKNCTSFLVTPAHLIFTTTTHLLKFVHITSVTGMEYFLLLHSFILTTF